MISFFSFFNFYKLAKCRWFFFLQIEKCECNCNHKHHLHAIHETISITNNYQSFFLNLGHMKDRLNHLKQCSNSRIFIAVYKCFLITFYLQMMASIKVRLRVQWVWCPYTENKWCSVSWSTSLIAWNDGESFWFIRLCCRQ